MRASLLAYCALLLWPIVSASAFAALRPAAATLVTVVGALLLLPERLALNLPRLPPLGKHEIASLSAAAGCLVVARGLSRSRPLRGIELLLIVVAASAFGTVFTNSDSVPYGPITLPPLQWWEALSVAGRDLILIVTPFYLGRALFRSGRELVLLMVFLVCCGLAYSLPILLETRISPKLHLVLYGFSAHKFHMVLRMGGYRPTVFMIHGLAVAQFILLAILASIALARSKVAILGLRASVVAVYLLVVLLLCRSATNYLYALVLLPIAAVGRAYTQARLSQMLALLVLAYPLLKIGGLVPEQPVVELARSAGLERVSSLEGRLEQERLMLEKGLQRPIFGWGGFGRNQVYDSERGERIVGNDGFWIIAFTSRGMLGLYCIFLLLFWPVLVTAGSIHRVPSARDRTLLSSLSLMVAAYCGDLVPNGFFFPLHALLSGALLGSLRGILAQSQTASARNHRARGHSMRRGARDGLGQGA